MPWHSTPQLMQTRLTSMQCCTERNVEMQTPTCVNAKPVVSVTAELVAHGLAADAHNVSEVPLIDWISHTLLSQGYTDLQSHSKCL